MQMDQREHVVGFGVSLNEGCQRRELVMILCHVMRDGVGLSAIRVEGGDDLQVGHVCHSAIPNLLPHDTCCGGIAALVIHKQMGLGTKHASEGNDRLLCTFQRKLGMPATGGRKKVAQPAEIAAATCGHDDLEPRSLSGIHRQRDEAFRVHDFFTEVATGSGCEEAFLKSNPNTTKTTRKLQPSAGHMREQDTKRKHKSTHHFAVFPHSGGVCERQPNTKLADSPTSPKPP